MAASSMNYCILGPLAVLSLVAVAIGITAPAPVSAQIFPGVPALDNIIMVLNGTLFCSPNITNCSSTTAGACPPLANAAVTLGLGDIPFAINTTNNLGFFAFDVALTNPSGLPISANVSVNNCPPLSIPGEVVTLPVTVVSMVGNTAFATLNGRPV